MRYIAIVHTWNDGSIDYVSVCDNRRFKSVHVDGQLSPLWLRERAALLRLCEINRSEKGEVLGRKFSNNMVYVYLNLQEYKELSNLQDTGAKENEAKETPQERQDDQSNGP